MQIPPRQQGRFQTSRAAIKKGNRYETLVAQELRGLYGDAVELEAPLNDGFADMLIRGPIPIIVECKSTYCVDAYWQLLQYARAFDCPVIRVCVTATNDRDVSTPEIPQYIMGLDKLHRLRPGYYVAPWTGKFSRRERALRSKVA